MTYGLLEATARLPRGGDRRVAWQAHASGEALAALSTQIRVQLLAAMQQHLDRIASIGAYPALDLSTGKLRLLQPASGHPMVLQMSNYYCCAPHFMTRMARQ